MNPGFLFAILPAMATKDTARKRGRPVAEDPRCAALRVRLTESERAAVDDAAEKSGKRLSVWIRAKLLRDLQVDRP